MAISQITTIGYIASVLLKCILNGLLVPSALDRNNFLKMLVRFLSLLVIRIILHPKGFSARDLFSEPLNGLWLSSRNTAKITHLLRGCSPTCLHAFNHRCGLILICTSFKSCLCWLGRLLLTFLSALQHVSSGALLLCSS